MKEEEELRERLENIENRLDGLAEDLSSIFIGLLVIAVLILLQSC